jgi:hypothetical protein
MGPQRLTIAPSSIETMDKKGILVAVMRAGVMIALTVIKVS